MPRAWERHARPTIWKVRMPASVKKFWAGLIDAVPAQRNPIWVSLWNVPGPR